MRSVKQYHATLLHTIARYHRAMCYGVECLVIQWYPYHVSPLWINMLWLLWRFQTQGVHGSRHRGAFGGDSAGFHAWNSAMYAAPAEFQNWRQLRGCVNMSLDSKHSANMPQDQQDQQTV